MPNNLNDLTKLWGILSKEVSGYCNIDNMLLAGSHSFREIGMHLYQYTQFVESPEGTSSFPTLIIGRAGEGKTLYLLKEYDKQVAIGLLENRVPPFILTMDEIVLNKLSTRRAVIQYLAKRLRGLRISEFNLFVDVNTEIDLERFGDDIINFMQSELMEYVRYIACRPEFNSAVRRLNTNAFRLVRRTLTIRPWTHDKLLAVMNSACSTYLPHQARDWEAFLGANEDVIGRIVHTPLQALIVLAIWSHDREFVADRDFTIYELYDQYLNMIADDNFEEVDSACEMSFSLYKNSGMDGRLDNEGSIRRGWVTLTHRSALFEKLFQYTSHSKDGFGEIRFRQHYSLIEFMVARYIGHLLGVGRSADADKVRHALSEVTTPGINQFLRNSPLLKSKGPEIFENLRSLLTEIGFSVEVPDALLRDQLAYVLGRCQNPTDAEYFFSDWYHNEPLKLVQRSVAISAILQGVDAIEDDYLPLLQSFGSNESIVNIAFMLFYHDRRSFPTAQILHEIPKLDSLAGDWSATRSILLNRLTENSVKAQRLRWYDLVTLHAFIRLNGYQLDPVEQTVIRNAVLGLRVLSEHKERQILEQVDGILVEGPQTGRLDFREPPTPLGLAPSGAIARNLTHRILIITVTDVETRSIFQAFSDGKIPTRLLMEKKTYYDLGMHGGASVILAQSEMGSATPGGSLLTVRQAIEDMHPEAIIMCGIAFGLQPHKQRLGDILIARQMQYYEPQKVDIKRGRMARGDLVTTSERLLDRFRSAALEWTGASIHFGLVVSGERLVNDPDFRDELLKVAPEAIGGEMEGAGLYSAARHAKVDWIIVKAICDWADGAKDDDAQPLAASNASRFVLHMLRCVGWSGVK